MYDDFEVVMHSEKMDSELEEKDDFEDMEILDDSVELSDEYQIDSLESVDTISYEFNQDDIIELASLDDLEVVEDYDDYTEDIKVKTLPITPEIIEERNKETEITLDGYKENLCDRGVPGDKIYEFIESERTKIESEFESLDRGEVDNNRYYVPTDWDSVAQSLNTTNTELLNEDIAESEEIVGECSSIFDANIYDVENLFEGTDICKDAERLDSALREFKSEIWNEMDVDEQKEAINNLADYVKEAIGFDKPPTIEYYSNDKVGEYGGYDPLTNTLSINEYMLYDNKEAADTIAHELWHAHQRECADNPKTERDFQYIYNFDNYIKPEWGHEAYENQLLEAEAREFAAQLKERLSDIERKMG